MKNILILVHEDVVLSSAAAPLDIFTRTNDMLRAAGQPQAFSVELVGERHENSLRSDPALFQCRRTLAEIPPKSDGHNRHLIVVPAFSGDWQVVQERNRAAIEWLQQHYRAGTEIASLCVGSLYLVEKFCGHDIGVKVAKNFSIHRDHINQAHFAVFKGLNQHGDREILKAQNFIESHYRENISVDQAAERVNMSKRNFIRRFKQATQLTPLDYIQRVRVEAAKKALESPAKNNIQTLMYDVGYNDAKTFRDVFRRITGVTPQEYRNKYGREASA